MRILLASDLDKTLIFDNKISEENKDAIRRFKEAGGVFAISTGRPYNGVEKVIEELIDKTLIFDNKISEENKDAIRRFKEAGGVFAISTGRPYNGVEKVIEELRVNPDYLILNNGALIITGNEEIVHREFIPFNVVKSIFNDMDNDEVLISVETGFRILNNGALIITGNEEIVHREFIPFNVVKSIFNDMDNDEVLISVETGFRTYPIDLKSKGAEAAFISDIDSTFKNLELIDKLDQVFEEDKEKIAAISLFLPRVDVNVVQDACDYVNDNYGNYVIAYRNTRFIDIVPVGCSKGSGVKWISKEENIDINKEKIAAISLFLPRVDVNVVQDACDYVNDNYGNYVIAYRNTRFIDIVPVGCSKGSGVKWISKEENIDIKDVYVIGDSWNDDSMFEITDKSFTFTYAEEALKTRTNYIVETVAECIDKYIL